MIREKVYQAELIAIGQPIPTPLMPPVEDHVCRTYADEENGDGRKLSTVWYEEGDY